MREGYDNVARALLNFELIFKISDRKYSIFIDRQVNLTFIVKITTSFYYGIVTSNEMNFSLITASG